MISLVGPASGTEYPLPLVTRELQGALDALYDAGRLSELIDPHAALAAFNSDFPTPPQTDWPRPRLGTIFWPVVGMARYAYACLLVDEYTVGQLRSQMTSTAGNTITIKLRDDPTDGAEAARSIAMQFLASRPLVRTTGASLTGTDNGTDPVDAWVVILVDDRYRTLTQSLTSITTTAWSDVFSSLGVTIGDAVDADYLTPGARWALSRVKGRSIGWLADIAALCVGSRIVKVPGGSPTLQRPTTGNATTLSSAHTAAGTRFFGGGPVETLDVYAGMPNSVRVTFGSPTETTPVVVDSSVQTAYVWPSSAYLSHWCDAPASTSGGNRTALADQWKADWYAWQGAFYDTAYSGFVAAPASAYLWNVVWDHSAETGSTRFVRPPHWYGFLLPPQYGSDAISGITVEEVDGSPSYTGITTVRFDQADGFVVTNPSTGVARIDFALTGTANTVPAYTGSGGVTETPLYVVPGTNTVTQYVVPNVGDDPTTSAIRQLVVANTGTPTITVKTLTNGTSGGNGLTETLTPTQRTVSYTINSQTGGYTVTESGGDIVFTFVAGTKVDLSAATVVGAVTGSGTAGKLAKFTSAGVLGDSIITETGSAIAVGGTLAALSSLTLQYSSGTNNYVATVSAGMGSASLAQVLKDMTSTTLGTVSTQASTTVLYQQVSNGSFTRGNVYYSIVDATGTANGGSGTTGGLTFVGGLYVSGTASLAIGSVTGLGTGVATWLATPTSANLASAITDETGSGALVFATSPTLVTPTLGVASATTVNKVTLTAPATGSTLTVADGKTFTASNTVTLTATDGATLAIGGGGALGTAAYLASDTDATLAADSNSRLATQSAVKAYVDNLITGRSWKTAVRVATTANGTLATAYENGDTLDGVTLATGDRILLKNQTSGAENGIYVVAASGAPTRATDADSSAELVNATVMVSEGTAGADTQWTCTTNAPITVGVTALVWAQIGASGAGTVTSFSAGDLSPLFTTSEATATTTPALTFALNTQSANVVFAGPASGGAAAPTFRSLVTADLPDDGVTYAKIQNVSATDKLLGRSTAGAGDVEEIACTAAARTVLDDTTVAAMVDTLGGAPATGTGGLARATSPTFVTPALGTPASGALTNCTGLGVGGVAAGVMRGYIDGLITSRASTTTCTVAAGCARDSTDAYSLYLSSATTKILQPSGSWTAGTGNNGLDTGAVANNTWYHVYVIATATGGSVDVLFSTSATAPTMPATYTLKRRIGSIKTNGSAQIVAYTQVDRDFFWDVPVADVAAANPGTAAVTRTLTVPTGVKVKPYLGIAITAATNTDNAGSVLISDLSVTDTAASVSALTFYSYNGSAVGNQTGGSPPGCWTNTSGQVRSRLQISAAGTTLYINTTGWFDARGENT